VIPIFMNIPVIEDDGVSFALINASHVRGVVLDSDGNTVILVPDASGKMQELEIDMTQKEFAEDYKNELRSIVELVTFPLSRVISDSLRVR